MTGPELKEILLTTANSLESGQVLFNMPLVQTINNNISANLLKIICATLGSDEAQIEETIPKLLTTQANVEDLFTPDVNGVIRAESLIATCRKLAGRPWVLATIAKFL
jgi:hypothetical protein